jgi:hypothetical protein
VGLSLEDSGKPEDAAALFQKAWHEATDDYERFIAAYHFGSAAKECYRQIKMAGNIPAVCPKDK